MHRAVRQQRFTRQATPLQLLHQSARCTGRCGSVSVNPRVSESTCCINQPDAQGGAAAWSRTFWVAFVRVASISPMHRAVRPPGWTQSCGRGSLVASISPMHRAVRRGRHASRRRRRRRVASISPMHRAVRRYCTWPWKTARDDCCINQPDAQGGAAPSCPWNRQRLPSRCINQPDAQGGAASRARHSMLTRAPCCINQPDAQGGAATLILIHHTPKRMVASISPMHRAVRHKADGLGQSRPHSCINQPDAQALPLAQDGFLAGAHQTT